MPCPVDIEPEEADVKRTRRIEVIRYTRRVTIVQGGGAIAVTHESPAIDITPVQQEATPPAPEGEDKRPAVGDTVEPQTLRRPAFRLRDLLRLRKRL